MKDFISSFGEGSSDLARRFGGNTADIARNFGGSAAELAKYVGSEAADRAKQVNRSAAKLAKKVGPKRGLIGLAVFGAAIAGTVVLVRYLRARAEEAELSDEELKLNEEAQAADPHRRHKMSRAKRKASNEPMTH